MAIEYRDFHESSLEEQRRLFAECFHEAHVVGGAAYDHYQWKFKSPELLQIPREFSAWEDSRLIGYYGALPFEYQIGEQRMVCGMVCDVMTRSIKRGRGVFTELGRFSLKRLKEEGTGFALAFPIRPQVLPGFLKTRWKVAFELPLYIKVLKTNALLRSPFLKYLSPFSNGVVSFYNRILQSSSMAQNKSLKVESYSKDEFLKLTEYEKFFRDWTKSQRNYLVKDQKFLRWRLGTPRANYRVVVVRNINQSTVEAVAITRKVEFKGISCLAILDMMFLDSNKNILFLLHQGLAEEGLKQGTDLIVSMMSRVTAKRLKIFANGFIRGPAKFKLILNKLDDKISWSDLDSEKNWNLMWIDSDDN